MWCCEALGNEVLSKESTYVLSNRIKAGTESNESDRKLFKGVALEMGLCLALFVSTFRLPEKSWIFSSSSLTTTNTHELTEYYEKRVTFRKVRICRLCSM